MILHQEKFIRMKKSLPITSKAILITRPNHDLVTTYISAWAKLVLNESEKRGIPGLDLAYKKANRVTFESYTLKNQPRLIFLNGHGSEDFITGFNNEVLISSGSANLLRGKIIYARSCDAGAKLGSQLIKGGVFCFIGYKQGFVVGYSEEYWTRSLQDKVARLFLEPSNLVPISFLKGNSAIDAYRKSQSASFKNFSFALSTKATPLEKDAAPYLWHNRKYQVILGKLEVKF